MKDKLREMYENGLRGIEPSISANGLLKAVANGWITTEDAVEILGSDNALETVRAAKLLEISKACNAVIVAGVDVPIGDRRDHFNLKLEDQSNINNLFRVLSWEVLSTPIRPMMEPARCILLPRLLRFTLRLRR